MLHTKLFDPASAVSAFAERTKSAITPLRTTKAGISAFEKLARTTLFLPVYVPVALLLRGAAHFGLSIAAPARTSSGSTMMCKLTDLIGWYVWLFGEWEPDVTRFVSSRLSDGDVFVDVGANIGYYSLLASRYIGERGSVVAVEASPGVFAELCHNIETNHLAGRIRPVNAAASAAAGAVTIFAGPDHNVGMSTTVPSRKLRAEATVAALPLEEMLTPSEIAATRIIKIDVEGAEPDVLAGMTTLIPLLRNDAEIVIELSPRWWERQDMSPVDILRPFLDGGFTMYAIGNDYSPWRYLWLNDVRDGRRMPGKIGRRTRRLDVVLSRRDTAHLPMTAI
jgi:FkbM family methyltransferase